MRACPYAKVLQDCRLTLRESINLFIYLIAYISKSVFVSLNVRAQFYEFFKELLKICNNKDEISHLLQSVLKKNVCMFLIPSIRYISYRRKTNGKRCVVI